MAGVAAWPSATKTAPAMTSGIPLVNSRTWFRIPAGRDLVGGKRFIRAIEHPDADEHIRPAIEQKIFPKSWLLAQQRHKALLHEARNLAGGAVCQREISDDREHVPAPRSGPCWRRARLLRPERRDAREPYLGNIATSGRKPNAVLPHRHHRPARLPPQHGHHPAEFGHFATVPPMDRPRCANSCQPFGRPRARAASAVHPAAAV